MLHHDRFRRLSFIFIVFLVLTGATQALRAQPFSGSATSGSESKSGNNDSPRYMLRSFLELMKRNDLEGALPYIEFSRRMSIDRQENLAGQLMMVLNKRGQIDLAHVSDDPDGRAADAMNPDMEIIGRISVGGEVTPIELHRSQWLGESRKVWRFSAEFMDRIPSLAERVQSGGVEASLPPVLVNYSLFNIRAWQWIGLLLVVVFAYFFSNLLARGLLRVARAISRRMQFDLTPETTLRLRPALQALGALLIFRVAESFLELPLGVRQGLRYCENIVLALVVTFVLLRIVEAFIQAAQVNFERQGRSSAKAMLQPVQKGIKAVVVALSFLWLLRSLGFDVTALIAGLGVGGLAIALAGQKTIENLFGGISVILDQPVRVGDTGRFGDVSGTVEEIGLRSTKIRTLDRTILTIPNAEFSLMKLENYERRDKMRWLTVLGMRYETKPAQMRLLLMRLKELLIGHPMVLNDPARVRFVRLGPSSLEVEIFCFIKTNDPQIYWAVIEDLNLKIMDVVEQCGSGFAFPSTTVYVGKDDGLDEQRQQAALGEALALKRNSSFPQPLYPPEWVELRTDTLQFGPEPE